METVLFIYDTEDGKKESKKAHTKRTHFPNIIQFSIVCADAVHYRHQENQQQRRTTCHSE